MNSIYFLEIKRKIQEEYTFVVATNINYSQLLYSLDTQPTTAARNTTDGKMTETLRVAMPVPVFGDGSPMNNEKVSQRSGFRGFFIRSSLRLHLSRRFSFVLCLAFHHPVFACVTRLSEVCRASETRGRLSIIRLPRRKPNDSASTQRSRPRCDSQGDFFAFNTSPLGDLVGQGPRDRYASITTPFSSSRTHGRATPFFFLFSSTHAMRRTHVDFSY